MRAYGYGNSLIFKRGSTYTPAQDLGANGVWYSLTESGLLVRNTQPVPDDWDMEAAGIARWSTYARAVPSKQAGAPSGSGSQVLRLAWDGTASDGYVLQSASVIVGNRYSWSVWARGDGTGSYCRAGMVAGGSVDGLSTGAWSQISGEDTNAIGVGILVKSPSGVGSWCEMDNFTAENLSVTTATPKAATGALVGANLVQALANRMPGDNSGLVMYDGLDWLGSALAASAWKFLHAGSCTIALVFTPSALPAGDNILGCLNTFLGGADNGFYLASTGGAGVGTIKYLVGNGTGTPSYTLTTGAGALVVGTTAVIIVRLTAGVQADVWVNGGAPTTQAEQAALSAANPSMTLGTDAANVSCPGTAKEMWLTDGALSDSAVRNLGQKFAALHGGTWA